MARTDLRVTNGAPHELASNSCLGQVVRTAPPQSGAPRLLRRKHSPPGFVGAVLRRYPPGDERLRLFALHPKAALLTGPTLDDVLDQEIAQLVAEGIVQEVEA
jgi:hypothetical protein